MFLNTLSKVNITRGDRISQSASSLHKSTNFRIISNSEGNKNKLNLFTRWDPIDNLLKLINNMEGLQRGKVMEFVGLSGSGKSHLLLAIIMVAILPYKIQFLTELDNGETLPINIVLGGMNEKVIFLNFNNQLNLLKLRKMLQSHLKLCLNKFDLEVNLEEFDYLIEYSLSNLIVFDLHSVEDLEDNLNKLENFQLIVNSKESGVRYLIIEHLSLIYWKLKINEEGGSKNELFYYQQKQISQLGRIMNIYNCSLLVTNWLLTKVDPDAIPQNPQLEREPIDPHFPWRDHMSSAWSNFVDYRVYFEQDMTFDKPDEEEANSTKFQLRLVKPKGYSNYTQSIYINRSKVYF
jgi:RecA/RadA recombinase